MNNSLLGNHRAIILAGMFLAVIFAFMAFGGGRTDSISAVLELRKDTGTSDGTLRTVALSDRLINQDLRFVTNRGQAGLDALFHVQAAGHTVLFFENQITLRRTEAELGNNEVILQFEGSNIAPLVEGKGMLPGVEHYYTGSDPDNWHTDVPTFSSVRYNELYSGIDLAYLGNDGALESTFYLEPGANVRLIRLNYQNVRSTTIRSDGALVVETDLGELIDKAPYAFQEIGGVNIEIESRYVLLEDSTVGFELGEYDRNYELVIDPELVFLVSYGTVFSIGFTSAEEVVIDDNGDLILAGFSNLNFPATNTIAASNDASISGLLMKLDGRTGEVLYSALFGGTGIDRFNGMAFDQAGNMYLTGVTESEDFPIMNGAQETLAGDSDAFLVILTADVELTHSTYLGGNANDIGADIVTDSAGGVFVVGQTSSLDFPTTAASFQEVFGGSNSDFDSGGDYFVTKFTALGSIDFATYIGGSSSERVCASVVNAAGELTITGVSTSTDFPLANAYQGTYGGGGNFSGDMTISRLNSNGDGLLYSTYIGGTLADGCSGVSMGANGEVFVSGSTRSEDFPIVGGQSLPEAGFMDGVLVMLDNAGQAVFSVRSNMAGDDEFVEVTVDENNTASVVSKYAATLEILEKHEGASLSPVFAFDAPGLRVHTAYAAGGYLAVAGEDLGPNGLAGQKASSGDFFCALMSLGRVDISCEWRGSGDGFLVITIEEGNVAPIRIGSADDPDPTINVRIGRDDDGNFTVNGVTKGPYEELRRIIVEGSEGDDDIDATGIKGNDFPLVEEIDISGNGGDDKLKGSDDIDNTIFGGAGDDELIGGMEEDALFGGSRGGGPVGNDHLDGRGGYDHFFYTHRTRSGTPFRKSGAREDAALLGSSDVLVILDSAGIDTLNFAGKESGITLNLDIMDAAQTLDAQGSLITLSGDFEVVLGSELDDEITLTPLAGVDRHVDGSDGTDILNYASESTAADDGSRITTTGFGDVTYVNIETVNLSIGTAIDESDATLPGSFSLSQNYPNPFNPTTSIQYSLPEAGIVSLNVYNSLGQKVAILVAEHQVAGNYSVKFDASGFLSASYFYELRAGSFVSSKKMTLLK